VLAAASAMNASISASRHTGHTRVRPARSIVRTRTAIHRSGPRRWYRAELPQRRQIVHHPTLPDDLTTSNLKDHHLVERDLLPGGRQWSPSGRRTERMAQQLTDRIEQFCTFQRKQRGKTEGGVTTYRWMLTQFLIFARGSEGRRAVSAT
jgi:hypothetical protein